MPKSNQQQSRSRQKPLGRRLACWLILVVILFAVGLVVGHFSTEPEPRPAPVVEVTTIPSSREVILYFAAADGQSLVAETKEVQDCQIEEDCLRETIQALITGPRGNLVPVVSAQTIVRGVTVEGSLVKVDFSQDLVAAHPGGTQSELLTIYALADTLAVNFPHLRQVQILVEGAPPETLKGHVDLRQPINPDFSLVEEGEAPVGPVGNLPAGGTE